MKATDRILNAFFDLEDSLDGDQRKDCRQRGFTFATKSQVMKLLKDQGTLFIVVEQIGRCNKCFLALTD
jgi:hypothetical protein